MLRNEPSRLKVAFVSGGARFFARGLRMTRFSIGTLSIGLGSLGGEDE